MSQSLPLKNQLKALENLQELDLKIDALRKKNADIPAALRALDETLEKARLSFEAKLQSVEEIEKVQRQTQAAVELNRDRLTRANGKLESVGNSQEFQAANKEIDQLKKMSANLEEQLKKVAQDIEAGNQEAAQLKETYEKLKAERDGQASTLQTQGGQLDSEIAALTSQREQFTKQIERRILAQYERIRPARGGVGIAPAMAGRCQACNMVLPPQQYNEVQRSTAVQQCSSCFRILFAPEATQG